MENIIEKRASRAWLEKAKIGLFTHYAYGTYRGGADGYGCTWKSASDSSKADSVEACAAALDAESYADAAADLGAQYVVFTVCHAGFNLLFPSETMIRTGCTHKCSKTDAVMPLLNALEKRGIPLVLYMPPNDNHDIDIEDLQKMGWETDEGREIFINALIDEIGIRYGGRIAGFWFDQCGPRDSAKEHVLKYNPDAAVYVNTGITENNTRHPLSDFLVSEYYGQIGSESSDTMRSHHSQINRIIGASWWASGGSATTTAVNLFRFNVRVIATEGQTNGGVDWACGPYIDQTWETGIRELMHGIGELVRARAFAIYDTVPGKSFVTKPGSVLNADDFGVSTEKGDIVYLHVMNPPANGALHLPETADGRVFTSAFLPDGTALEFRDNTVYYNFPENDPDFIVCLK